MEKLLREVCEMLNVSRRAVQGYEKTGLVKPTGKNKYGYLLYDEAAIDRIRSIKQYQDFGFSIKKIKLLMEVSDKMYMEMMCQRLEIMRGRREELDTQIKEAEELIKRKMYDMFENPVDCT